jgi:hypothetical protein
MRNIYGWWNSGAVADRYGCDSPDGAAFTAVGDIRRESLVPPRTTATLYRAAGRGGRVHRAEPAGTR